MTHTLMLLSLHSYYSLRYGTGAEALIEGLTAYGYDTAVLTDINNSSAVIEFANTKKQASRPWPGWSLG